MKSFLALFLVFSMSCASVRPMVPVNSKTIVNSDLEFFMPGPAKVKPVLEGRTATPFYVPVIKFNKEVDDDSVDDTIDLIEQAEKANADGVIIEINTPGGSVDAGFRLSEKIEDSKVPVTCLVTFEAASMGMHLLQSCETRTMLKRGVLMAHEPAMGGLVFGQPLKYEEIAKRLKALSRALAEHIARRMTISTDELEAKIANGKSWWINWEEAMAVGAVDSVTSTTKSFVESYRQTLKPPSN